MQASSTNVVYIHKEYNKLTSERMKVIKFLERLKDMVELVYGYKKNNPRVGGSIPPLGTITYKFTIS